MLGNRFTRLLMWMGLAAVATYFFDPERGDQRRKEPQAGQPDAEERQDMSKKAAKLAD